jgi:hypothetical protein
MSDPVATARPLRVLALDGAGSGGSSRRHWWRSSSVQGRSSSGDPLVHLECQRGEPERASRRQGASSGGAASRQVRELHGHIRPQCATRASRRILEQGELHGHEDPCQEGRNSFDVSGGGSAEVFASADAKRPCIALADAKAGRTLRGRVVTKQLAPEPSGRPQGGSGGGVITRRPRSDRSAAVRHSNVSLAVSSAPPAAGREPGRMLRQRRRASGPRLHSAAVESYR